MDDLLNDWQATVPLPYDGIRVAGTLWSAKSHNVKDFLARNRIPYQWLDIDSDNEARELVEMATEDQYRLPVVFFPDGNVLIEPDDRKLAEETGLQTQATQPFYDLIIVGGGPAGLGAAVYGGSEGLRTLMIERKATGGQAGTSSRIENYLGFPKGLSGAELAYRFIRHPLYASLMLFGWGVFLKGADLPSGALALTATSFWIATARYEERFNIECLGVSYSEYMKRTKMFVPFLL